jgi:hypothetical protein
MKRLGSLSISLSELKVTVFLGYVMKDVTEPGIF